MIDDGGQEFARKPIAFVGYGGVGAARSIEQLRLAAIELHRAPVRNAVHIGGSNSWLSGNRARASATSLTSIKRRPHWEGDLAFGGHNGQIATPSSGERVM